MVFLCGCFFFCHIVSKNNWADGCYGYCYLEEGSCHCSCCDGGNKIIQRCQTLRDVFSRDGEEKVRNVLFIAHFFPHLLFPENTLKHFKRYRKYNKFFKLIFFFFCRICFLLPCQLCKRPWKSTYISLSAHIVAKVWPLKK